MNNATPPASLAAEPSTRDEDSGPVGAAPRVYDGEPLTVRNDAPANNIIFHIGDPPHELLRIAPDGFYLRGARLEQDQDEARKVFDAFAEWLAVARR